MQADFQENQLLEKIFAFQVSGSNLYDDGHFQSNRFYPYLALKREDDNLFFTTLTISVLKWMEPFMDEGQKGLVEKICQSALPNFEAYQVKNDRAKVYQFWKTGKNNHFPNGCLLHHFKKFKSPPDADDTALAYLAKTHELSDVIEVREYLKQFANGAGKWNRKVPQFLNIPYVYSTWMGSGRMPIEFDIVVMSNLLRMFWKYRLLVNQYDVATMEYISEVVKKGYYIQRAFECAPWYPSPVIIHYHLTKLATETGYEQIEALIPYLRDQFKLLVAKSNKNHSMDLLLLHSSSMRLKVPYEIKQPVLPLTEAELAAYPFYIGGMLTATQSRWLWRLAAHPVFHWQFRCLAFNYTLMLENKVLKRI